MYVVFAAVFEFPQSLTDSFVGERDDPQAHERRGATRIVLEVAEDKLSRASGIGRHDDMFACVEQSFDDFYLRHHAAVGLVALLRPDLTGDCLLYTS